MVTHWRFALMKTWADSISTGRFDGVPMLSRGIFHAVTRDDLKQLRRTKDGPARRNLILQWDEEWPDEWRCSTDKAWKLISVALAFQAGPSEGGPEVGLGLGIDMFYGNCLHRADFYVIGHVPVDWLPEIVNSLEAIDEERYRDLYFSPEVQGDFVGRCFRNVHGIDTTEDRWREYSWKWLEKIKVIFRKARDDGRVLVFSADNC
jgi:hypothetical protein